MRYFALLFLITNFLLLLSIKHDIVSLQEKVKKPILYEVKTNYVIINPTDDWDIVKEETIQEVK